MSSIKDTMTRSMEKPIYHYYPLERSLNFVKWHADHYEDMCYRYKNGKMEYTLKEIVELKEEGLISKQFDWETK